MRASTRRKLRRESNAFCSPLRKAISRDICSACSKELLASLYIRNWLCSWPCDWSRRTAATLPVVSCRSGGLLRVRARVPPVGGDDGGAGVRRFSDQRLWETARNSPEAAAIAERSIVMPNRGLGRLETLVGTQVGNAPSASSSAMATGRDRDLK